MGVSKNRGTPKWMVKIMENPIKVDDLGVAYPYFGNTQWNQILWTYDSVGPGRTSSWIDRYN